MNTDLNTTDIFLTAYFVTLSQAKIIYIDILAF